MFKKINAYFRLFRPVNTIIGAISVFIAIYITKISPPFPETIYAMLSAVFLMAGGNAINDFFDYKIDSINKKNRPIPSGQVTRTEALVVTVLVFGVTLWLNLHLTGLNLYIIIICEVLLFLYTPVFKKIPLLGNFVVAGISATGFIYGAAVVHAWQKGLYPAIIAFFVHFTREIMKDAEDYQADLKENVRTFAGIVSPIILHVSISILLFMTTLIVIWGYVGGFFKITYLYVVITLVIPIYIYFGFKFIDMKERNLYLYQKGSLWMKLSMISGIFAFYVGMK